MAITPPATVQGWPKSLTWNLFRKVKSPPIPFKVAYTKYAIKPAYTPGWGTGTTGILKAHRLLNLSVLIQLDTSGCWVLDGKNTPQYLQHEQGHYDIGGLIARELYAKLNFISSPSDPSAVQIMAQSALEKMAAKEQQVTGKYDRETKGGDDAAMQAQWDRLLSDCIAKNRPLPNS